MRHSRRTLCLRCIRLEPVPRFIDDCTPHSHLLGYAGILLGPAIIGFLAHVSSLPIALMAVAVLLLGVALSGRMMLS